MSNEKVNLLKSLVQVTRTPNEASYDSPESIGVADRLNKEIPNSIY